MDPQIGSEIVHDGVEELGTLGELRRSRSCPACGSACVFDAVDAARTGIPVGWATTAAIDRLQRRLLEAFPFDVGEFDGCRTLRDEHGGTPHVSPVRCDRCGSELLVVVSYGEVQPARWRLVVVGLTEAGPA